MVVYTLPAYLVNSFLSISLTGRLAPMLYIFKPVSADKSISAAENV